MADNPMGMPSTDLIEGEGQMTEADLAKALGEELPAPAEPEPAAEAPAPEPVPEWEHQPTGKKFESELELLRYESGFKDNKYGTELKETKAKLEAFERMLDSAGEAPKQQLSPEQQEKELLKAALRDTGVDLENVDAGAYKTIVKMVENMLGLYDGTIASKRLEELGGKIEKITSRAQQAEALNSAGINLEQVKEVLEKHPSLKALSPGEQVAVIADLAKAQAPKQGTGESPNALRQALQPDPANHVEGSANTQPPDESDGFKEMAEKLTGDRYEDKAFLERIGQLTASGPKPWDEGFGQ